MGLAAKIVAAAVLALPACGQLLDLDQFENTASAGGATASAGTGGSAGAGGDTSVASVGPGGQGGSGGPATGGGGSLPCDPGWSFTPDPPMAGESFTLKFEHATPFVYVALIVEPATPMVTNGQATQGTPNIWDWYIVADAGVYEFHFTHKVARDNNPMIVASCTKTVVP